MNTGKHLTNYVIPVLWLYMSFRKSLWRCLLFDKKKKAGYDDRVSSHSFRSSDTRADMSHYYSQIPKQRIFQMEVTMNCLVILFQENWEHFWIRRIASNCTRYFFRARLKVLQENIVNLPTMCKSAFGTRAKRCIQEQKKNVTFQIVITGWTKTGGCSE